MFSVLFEEAPDGQRYIDWLISGLQWTVTLAFFGWCIAFVIGVAVGAGRTSPSRAIATRAGSTRSSSATSRC